VPINFMLPPSKQGT